MKRRVGARQRSADPPRNTGWQVRASVAQAVRYAVEAGAAASQNDFVERAVVKELRELRRSRVYGAYADAAADPLFLRDMEDVTAAFEPGDLEGLQGDGA